MSVKIGHASIDERGKARGGAAGDQTGREVCTRNWYNKPWIAVIRPKSSTAAEKIAKAMEAACANNNIGYDQNERTTLYIKAKANNWNIAGIKSKCETDCSALVAVCVNAAGISVSKDIYTGNEKSALVATGKFTAHTESKYLTTDNYLKRGDILLASGHTAVVLSNGSKATAGGNANADASAPDKYKEIIRSLQTALNSEYKAGLVVDGVPGSKTFGATPTLNKKTRAKKPKTVKALQSLLTYYGYKCDVDGDFYTATEKMVKSFQREVVGQKNPDGEVTAKNATWKKLLKLS
ncbi:peptidoglycan-binding protein [bacterium D16-51]|nr:peptidoglycan-binding protein [bacterium D16-59]RKI56270.1 peptidoglycan-binding protein [bacterium D16-51]